MPAPIIAAGLMTLVQSLAANGLSMIGNAVLAKGKDVIEEKLGVNLDEAVQSKDGLLKLKQLEQDHQEFLLTNALEHKRVDLDFYKADLADTANARDMNTRIQESQHASDFAKDAAYYLDFMIVGSTILLGGLLFFKAIPDDNVQIANIMFGSLIALCGTVVNFHRGNNRSSQQRAIAQIHKDEQP